MPRLLVKKSAHDLALKPSGYHFRIRSYLRDHTHPDNRRWTNKTEIDRAVMREYKYKPVRLPANLHKNPNYRGKSIDEVLAMSGVKPMSVSSIN